MSSALARIHTCPHHAWTDDRIHACTHGLQGTARRVVESGNSGSETAIEALFWVLKTVDTCLKRGTPSTEGLQTQETGAAPNQGDDDGVSMTLVLLVWLTCYDCCSAAEDDGSFFTKNDGAIVLVRSML